MTPLEEMREDRDRFVAFAFAAADLLIQIDSDSRITFVSGASVTLLGLPASVLLERMFIDLVDPVDRVFAQRIIHGLRVSGRINPVPVMMRKGDGARVRATLGGCQFPGQTHRSYITLAHLPTSFPIEDQDRDPETRLLNPEVFTEAAARLARLTDEQGANKLVVLHLDGLSAIEDSLPDAQRSEMRSEIAGILRGASLGGDMAGQVDSNTFSLVQPNARDTTALRQQLVDVTGSLNPAAKPLQVTTASISLDSGELGDQDAGQALIYCIKRFAETKGEGFSLSSLSAGFTEMMSETMTKVTSVRQTLAQRNFALAFQPIVDLQHGELHHYEVLCRFAPGQSPFELITFSEEVGLIEDLDFAVCAKALEGQKNIAVPERLAINLSGRSLQSPVFLARLLKLLDTNVRDARRVMFEITESAAIKNLEEANGFAQTLRKRGHPICLDDFGSGFTAYTYLRHFEVDYVKLDGPFLKSALKNPREAALIRSLCMLCTDLRSSMIGEMIENKAEADAARALGVRLGQGYYFGRPQPTPQMIKLTSAPKIRS